MSRICPNALTPVPIRHARVLLAVVLAGAAFAQTDSTGIGYFAHLSSPHLPTVQLSEVRLGGVSAVDTPDSIMIRQGDDVAVALRLALTHAQAGPIGVRIRLEGETGMAEQTHWIATNDWRVGGLNEWASTLHAPGLTLTGRGTLSISQLLPRGPGSVPLGDGKRIPVKEALLFRGPVFIQPAAFPSRVPDDSLAQVFDRPYARLNAAFRLAPTTSIRIDLPASEQGVIRGLGLVAALGGGFEVGQGTTIATVRCEPSGNTFAIKAGDDLSFLDAASPPPGIVQLDAAEPTLATPAPFADWHDAPVSASIYAAAHTLDPPQTVDALTIQYVHVAGYLDVFELVCMSDEPAAP